MSTIFSKPMFWGDQNCIQPTEIANIGYAAGDNPAAEHENYFRHQTYLCLQELQKTVNTLEAETVAEAGLCGENVFYLLRKDGTMTISGTGSVRDHAFLNREDITEMEIHIGGSLGDGSIPNNGGVFAGCHNLNRVSVNCSAIGDFAFLQCAKLSYLAIGNQVSKIGSLIFEFAATVVNSTIVEYAGTMEEWSAIQKNADWAEDGNLYKNQVSCTDGTVSIA